MPTDNEGHKPHQHDHQSSSTGNPKDQGTSSAHSIPPRKFSNPLTSVNGIQVNLDHEAHPNLTFQPLPPPTGPQPYHLSLDHVLPADKIAAITSAGRMVFHIVGDTGGVKSPQVQQIVANKMVSDCLVPDLNARPAFFYHLGDVVYYYGQSSEYFPQFYDPYQQYPLPIFAIPGNHDGDIGNSGETSLSAFVTNFCAPIPAITKDAGDTHRYAMTQPNVYWTLETPYVTFIGLYTNVPEGGQLDVNQIAWFESELTSAPTSKALIVSMHHPIYSADMYHSGSQLMKQVLEQAIQKTGRIPDAVFCGHVHNYQRFTHSLNNHEIPFIVAGAGGYWSLHSMQNDPAGSKIQKNHVFPGEDLTLVNYCDDHHGYMRIEATAQHLKCEYFAVPAPHDPPNTQTTLVDTFTLDYKKHKLL